MVEVHFAYMGMKAAEVRTCSAVSGKLVVAIPDACLEQSAPIIAWVYAISDNSGYTVKTITLPIIPRVKPQAEPSIPREDVDAYTQFLSEVNSAIDSIKEGQVVSARALVADSALTADNATRAAEADFAARAFSSDMCSNANYASFATKAGLLSIDIKTQKKISEPGLYLVKWKNSMGLMLTEIMLIDSLMASDIFSAGSISNDLGGTSGLMYSVYLGAITVTDGTLYDVYKLADHSVPLG